MNDNQCINCGEPQKDPLFWETHQTMSDGNIWCTKRKDR